MEIEQLTKSQLILLTLLVSFVTSIATGIVTVTLMEQAPEGVTRTITHVVEKTVDNVVPEPATQMAAVVKEVPVVITEEDLVVEAIGKVTPAVVVVRLAKESEAGGRRTSSAGESKDLGSAYLSDSSGVFTTASSIVAAGSRYVLVLDNKKEIEAEVSAVKGLLAELKVVDAGKFKEAAGTLSPLPKTEKSPAVGQSVISVAAEGAGNHKVTIGIIGSMIAESSTTPLRIISNAAVADHVGAPLVDIYGKLVGVVTGPATAVSS